MKDIYHRYYDEFKEIEQELDVKKEPWHYYTMTVLYEIVELLNTDMECVAELKDYFAKHHLRDFMGVGDEICEDDNALHWQIFQRIEHDANRY